MHLPGGMRPTSSGETRSSAPPATSRDRARPFFVGAVLTHVAWPSRPDFPRQAHRHHPWTRRHGLPRRGGKARSNVALSRERFRLR